jgi:hypothetical protein
VHDVQRVEDAAAVHAGVQVALADADVDEGLAHAAQPDGDRRRALVDHARVEDDRHVGAALVVADPVGDVAAAALLLALDEDAHVDRQLARGLQLARRVQQRQEVALVIGGAACVQAARRGPAARNGGLLQAAGSPTPCTS